MSKPWKEHERRTANRLGGIRNPLSGSMSQHTSGDIIHPKLYVECKYRSHIALLATMHNVERCSLKEGKTPVLVLQQKHAKQAYLLIRINDLEKVYESVRHK